MKEKLLYPTPFSAYVNTICFRNVRPTCMNISHQYNCNIISDLSQNDYVSHDKLQRVLNNDNEFDLYLQNRYGHLLSSRNKGFLIIDDTVLAKPYSKQLELLSWIWSSSDRQYLYGINVVFVIWTDGNTRFPIGYRIWNKNDKKTRIDLAIELLSDAKKIFGINPDYVLMDSFYPAAKLLKVIRKYKWHWIAKIKCNRRINKVQAKKFFKYRYGNHIGRLSENIKALIVKDNDNYWATSDLSLNSTGVKRLYVNRQAIEEFFKILKSELRIEGCSARSRTSQANHIYFVLFAFCQLEDFRIKKNVKTIYHLRLLLFRFTIPKNLEWDIDPLKYA